MMQNNNASDNVILNICLLREITFKCIYYEIEQVLAVLSLLTYFLGIIKNFSVCCQECLEETGSVGDTSHSHPKAGSRDWPSLAREPQA